ncbi:hypothetical protein BDV26DRAFT_291902 [Aspergillus bertholletiae]|uniref:Uncharacterized protein n=1 Tax=Aspergillus bertholletiae TaxID=1226010 RepID=A0A5N7BAL3_9EURO|nr:hypothetical protein BDV26DRAFT_291902 [Aspergillus bertholletiae]
MMALSGQQPEHWAEGDESGHWDMKHGGRGQMLGRKLFGSLQAKSTGTEVENPLSLVETRMTDVPAASICEQEWDEGIHGDAKAPDQPIFVRYQLNPADRPIAIATSLKKKPYCGQARRGSCVKLSASFIIDLDHWSLLCLIAPDKSPTAVHAMMPLWQLRAIAGAELA